MKDFKKRTLILMLATTVSVTGSFAADNYKNCLMNLEFKPAGTHEINVILNTKSFYEDKISPIKKDANTFIIMLPEIDNAAPTPDLSGVNGDISSVEIRKMPYSNGAKGYTKILIKTSGSVNLNATSAKYIPSEDSPRLADKSSGMEEDIQESPEIRDDEPEFTDETPARTNRSEVTRRTRPAYNEAPARVKDPSADYETEDSQEENSSGEVKQNPENSEDSETGDVENKTAVTYSNVHSEETSNQKKIAGLATLAIIMISLFLILKAKDKLTNVIGENLEIDLDDKEEQKTTVKSDKRKISKTVNKLDRQFSQNNSIQLKPAPVKAEHSEDDSAEEANIVDLDALFKEKQSETSNNQQDIKDDLDDFLSEFSFDDSELTEKSDNIEEEEEEEEIGLYEAEYERLLSSQGIKFNKDDIECFKQLLQSEISDEAIKSIENSGMTNPIKKQGVSADKLLETLVTDYAVSRNIIFSSSDIDIMRKLMSVEIDKDFLKDLRTNPKRTAEMEKEIIAAQNQLPEPEEIVTLNVKGMLPDLAEALKKQGNKPIRSEVKPQVVYYNEGYEFTKLSTDIELPDLSKEMNNKSAYISKPSAAYLTVDTSYSDSVDKISTSGLPDLTDVMANPKKYEEPEKEAVVVDEEELLKSIMNVQFKPFDDGSRKFEIVNDDIEYTEEIAAEDIINIEKEFDQFNNFEIKRDDDFEPVYTQEDYDDFEELYKNNFVNLDSHRDAAEGNISEPENKQEIEKLNNKEKDNEPPKEKEESFIPKNLERAVNLPKREKRQTSEELDNVLKKIREERKNRKLNEAEILAKKEPEIRKNEHTEAQQTPVKCILEGINYDIVSSAVINSGMGCHLAKSKKGYAVLAYKGDELSVIKEYETVNSNKLHLRLSETLDDGTLRYLVRIGTNKFIIDYKDKQVRYVMDLC